MWLAGWHPIQQYNTGFLADYGFCLRLVGVFVAQSLAAFAGGIRAACLTACAATCLLLQASEYKIPIYITETGIADKKDGNRSHMIDEYMRAVSIQQSTAGQ